MKKTLLLFISAFLLTHCASTESLEEVVPPAETEAKTEKDIPEWYDFDIVSSSDSEKFSGYSLATASDSIQAVTLAQEMALVNLRFGIDRFAEEIRRNGIEDSAGLDSPLFIISLRNAIQALNLQHAAFDTGHNIDEAGIHRVYARASLARSEVIRLLSVEVDHEHFNAHLKQTGTEAD